MIDDAPDLVEVTLTWSTLDRQGDTPYLGDAGETTVNLTQEELWALAVDGRREGQTVVTSAVFWPRVPHTLGWHGPYS